MTSIRNDGQAGLTLVELMVVLVLVSIGVLTLVAVQTRSSTDIYDTGRNTRALALAQERIEIARGAGWNVATTDSGAVGTLNWRTDVDSIGPRLSRVRVTVRWAEAGSPRSYQLNTMIAGR